MEFCTLVVAALPLMAASQPEFIRHPEASKEHEAPVINLLSGATSGLRKGIKKPGSRRLKSKTSKTCGKGYEDITDPIITAPDPVTVECDADKSTTLSSKPTELTVEQCWHMLLTHNGLLEALPGAPTGPDDPPMLCTCNHKRVSWERNHYPFNDEKGIFSSWGPHV